MQTESSKQHGELQNDGQEGRANPKTNPSECNREHQSPQEVAARNLGREALPLNILGVIAPVPKSVAVIQARWQARLGSADPSSDHHSSENPPETRGCINGQPS
jgi:hypothetical protein